MYIDFKIKFQGKVKKCIHVEMDKADDMGKTLALAIYVAYFEP